MFLEIYRIYGFFRLWQNILIDVTEYKLRVNETSMLRRILGSKEENISGCNKQFNDFHNMYFSPSIIKVIIYERGWDRQGM
jgi:hypothetical protein